MEEWGGGKKMGREAEGDQREKWSAQRKPQELGRL